ncbi:hypothetical protein SLEP1_g22355 [Rubroshorea leprosula]|uniref:Reverse transcriptase domain-containing protein n=1 Tax=Rubroshorea leprosula TaxID=152421 RepID=A0AAV5JI70_9ROSI|nr:hypothetical protein SLEP1_g22355 [Rubroshorea leprosula]
MSPLCCFFIKGNLELRCPMYFSNTINNSLDDFACFSLGDKGEKGSQLSNQCLKILNLVLLLRRLERLVIACSLILKASGEDERLSRTWYSVEMFHTQFYHCEPEIDKGILKFLDKAKETMGVNADPSPVVFVGVNVVDLRSIARNHNLPYAQRNRAAEDLRWVIKAQRYAEWLSNVVLVLKKNGKLRVYVDFRNLNLAIPKDEYLMPIADLLVDGVACHKILSFMVGHGAVGTFEYIMMPFGLNNAEATYQRAMNAIFNDMIGKFMEIYTNDVVVKSHEEEDHLIHLRKAFERMRQHGLKMNPLKCAFEVSIGNFLGYLVHERRLEVDRNKAKAMIEAQPPQNKKELQRFLGQVNFLRHFISNLVGKTRVFSPLLKLKFELDFKWEE